MALSDGPRALRNDAYKMRRAGRRNQVGQYFQPVPKDTFYCPLRLAAAWKIDPPRNLVALTLFVPAADGDRPRSVGGKVRTE